MSRSFDEIDYPKTAEEWWTLLEGHQESLRNLTANYHPDQYRRHDQPISAAGAEVVCELTQQEIRARSNAQALPPPLERFDAYLAAHDRQMHKLLGDVWFGLPESMDSRSEPGFGVLCDLCSEGSVLWTDEELEAMGEE